MTEVIGVSFKDGGKVYFFDPAGITVEEKQEVIVDTSRGIEFGICAEPNRQVEDNSIVTPLRPLVRIATDEDRKRLSDNKIKEKKAFDVCVQKIAEHNLDMKLIEVEYNFDGSKILFFFTSDGRVDFRELVKSLATIFKTRIELRQIGVRDEAKLLGGLGICGKPFCCSSFLEDFQPVSIKMAKTQNLSLNPTKISGTCGRLMCCLKYEQDAYESLLKETPRVDARVMTPDGPGRVTDVSLIRGILKVRLASDGELASLHSYKNDEISPVDAEGNPTRPVAKRVAKPPVTSFEDSMPSVRYNSDRSTPGDAEGSDARAPRQGDRRPRYNSGHSRPGAPAAPRPEQAAERPAAPAPAQSAPAAEGAVPGGQAKKRRHRPGKKKPEGQPGERPAQGEQARPAPQNGQPHKPHFHGPRDKSAAPQPPREGGEGQPRQNNNRRHRPGRKKPEGGAPGGAAPTGGGQ